MAGQPDEASNPHEPQPGGLWTQLDVIRFVRAGSPLVFYALAFVTLTFFGAAVVWSLEGIYRFIFAVLILIALVAIFGAVWWINVRHHSKLVLGEVTQFRLLMAQYGTRDQPVESSANDRLSSVPPPDLPQELPKLPEDTN